MRIIGLARKNYERSNNNYYRNLRYHNTLVISSPYLLSDKYTISQYRNDLKDLFLVIYIPLTLWLVLITRKMSEIALNAQIASNRPELKCTLLITDERPEALQLKTHNLEIISSRDAEYVENLAGAYVFLLVQNLDGSGKAIKLKLAMKFEANIPEKISLDRNFQINYLSHGDSLACYIYRFDWPGLPATCLKLDECKVSYTTPFDEASKNPSKEIFFDSKHLLPVEGNQAGPMNLGDGISKKIWSGAQVPKTKIATESSPE